MPLYYAPCITYGGTRFYLPPWIEARAVRSQHIEKRPLPQTDRMLITNIKKNQGTQLRLNVSGYPSVPSQAAVLSWYEQIWTHLSGKKFNLFIFSDRAWPNCAMETIEEPYTLDPLRFLRDVGISIVSEASEPSTSLQLSFSNYNSEYPYASQVGRPSGDAISPGSVTPVTEPSQANYSGQFNGVVNAATSSGQEHRFTVGGSSGSTWRVKGLQITAADPLGTTGATTVRLSTAAIGGSGSVINATVGSSSYFGSEATSNILVTAGDTLYVFVPTSGGGGHQNVQYRFRLEAQ